jgi:hypothetical protein
MPSAALPTALATSRLVGVLDIDRQGPRATERPETDRTASFAEAANVKQAERFYLALAVEEDAGWRDAPARPSACSDIMRNACPGAPGRHTLC